MVTLAHTLYAILNIALLVLAVQVFLRDRRLILAGFVVAVAGLVYDNSIIALGRFIGEGSLLMNLNYGRFVWHIITTPLFCLIGLYLTRNATVEWAWTRRATVITWLLGLFAFAWLAYYHLLLLQLTPAYAGETIRYVNGTAKGPPLAEITVMGALVFFGIGVVIKTRWHWLLTASIVVFITASFASSIGVVANFGEVILMAGLVFTARKFPSLTRAQYEASQNKLTPEERTRLANDQRERKRKLAVYNRYLAWVTVPTLLLGTLAYYQKQIGIEMPGWMNPFFNSLFIVLFFVHSIASLYFFGIPRPRMHIRVFHIYIGYAVFLFTMVSQSVIGMEPLHIITYILNWVFIGLHLALSIRFMVKRVTRQKQDPMLDFAISKKLTVG